MFEVIVTTDDNLDFEYDIDENDSSIDTEVTYYENINDAKNYAYDSVRDIKYSRVCIKNENNILFSAYNTDWEVHIERDWTDA